MSKFNKILLLILAILTALSVIFYITSFFVLRPMAPIMLGIAGIIISVTCLISMCKYNMDWRKIDGRHNKDKKELRVELNIILISFILLCATLLTLFLKQY